MFAHPSAPLRFYHVMSEEMMMRELSFGDCRIELITRDGELWARLPQIGAALGYANPYKVQQLYERNADEFTETMTSVIDLPSAGGIQRTRIFSLRGAHLLAMFARTKAAKDFRRWVLDILDALHYGAEYVSRRYRQAREELEQGREMASDCGRGLNSWKRAKKPLEARVEYWSERRQLTLGFESA